MSDGLFAREWSKFIELQQSPELPGSGRENENTTAEQ